LGSGDPLTKALPRLLREVRDVVGERRVTVVFDRGGWSPKLFGTMIKDGFDLLTYRKGRCRRINERRFIRRRAELDGRWVDDLLHDQPVGFLKGKLRLRQVTRLCDEAARSGPSNIVQGVALMRICKHSSVRRCGSARPRRKNYRRASDSWEREETLMSSKIGSLRHQLGRIVLVNILSTFSARNGFESLEMMWRAISANKYRPIRTPKGWLRAAYRHGDTCQPGGEQDRNSTCRPGLTICCFQA
jgi:hypothetical protein